MKKYLLFLCVFVILGACTNTIGYLPDDEPKKLIVNAMMQTENNDNRILSALHRMDSYHSCHRWYHTPVYQWKTVRNNHCGR